jgi:hypothetical protein
MGLLKIMAGVIPCLFLLLACTPKTDSWEGLDWTEKGPTKCSSTLEMGTLKTRC